MVQPLFSITTPCWNSASTIERTIKSVLAQNIKDYEYIIVDGGSTDGTIDIIRQYEPLFEGRMKWKSEPDKGLYDAFNKGVQRSTGLYCWNVNADDYIEPDALQNIKNIIDTSIHGRFPIISGGMNFVDKDGNILSTSIKNESGLKQAFENDYIGVSHPATLVPKEIYERHGAFDPYYKIIGDTDWFHRVYEAGEQFLFTDIIITNMSDGGVSNMFSYRRSLRDRLYFLRKFYNNPITRIVRLAQWTKAFYSQKRSHNRKNE